jgi:hypothetical protein
MNNLITINALKFDGKLHRSWQVELIEENAEFWKLVGEFDQEIKHPLLGVIRRGTVSVEYYWKQHWYNVFLFYEPEGDFRNFYCNINMPPNFQDNFLEYIDLDIDVFIDDFWRVQVLDLEEFAANILKYNYPAEIIAKAKAALDELHRLINNRDFPFNLV